MKLQIVSAVLLAAIAAGCSSSPEFQSGPDAEVTHDGLTKVDRTIMDAVWARTDIDLSGVSKVRFNDLGVEYRNVDGPYSGRAGVGSMRTSSQSATQFQLDDETKALFEEEISAAFREEILRSEKFEVVDYAGPDVVDVHIGLLDVVSRVPPDTVGRSRMFIDSVGEATVVLELRDSISHTVLVRAVDRRAADSAQMFESSPPRNRAEVRRLGRHWGRIVRDGLENILGGGLD